MNKKQDAESFKNITELLEHVELDNSASKEHIYHRLIYKMETGTIKPHNKKKDGIPMKKSKWIASIVMASTVICIGGAFSTTSYAQDMLQSIMAKFQVGNMNITQYDKEVPPSTTNSTSVKGDNESRETELPKPAHLTVQEARTALNINFPAPSRLMDYEFVNCIVQGDNMIDVVFAKGAKSIDFLISKGGNNGISTTDEVTTEIINGTKVFHANGIVIWEHEDFTVEMYSQDDYDSATLGKIIDSFTTETPLHQAEIGKAEEKVRSTTTNVAPAIGRTTQK